MLLDFHALGLRDLRLPVNGPVFAPVAEPGIGLDIHFQPVGFGCALFDDDLVGAAKPGDCRLPRLPFKTSHSAGDFRLPGAGARHGHGQHRCQRSGFKQFHVQFIPSSHATGPRVAVAAGRKSRSDHLTLKGGAAYGPINLS